MERRKSADDLLECAIPPRCLAAIHYRFFRYGGVALICVVRQRCVAAVSTIASFCFAWW